MKVFIHLILAIFVPLSIASADDKAAQEQYMREAVAKERARAQESMKNHSNAEKFQERFGHLKEKHPDHLAALMSANKKAAEAWDGVIRKAEGANNTDVLSEAKQVANAASADANLAEMTLRYVASAAERKNMTVKTRDRDVATLVSKIDANEKAILLATRAKNEAHAANEKLNIENRNLNNELRKAYDEARKKDEGKDRDKDHDNERRKKERAEGEKKNHNNAGGGGDEEGGTGVLGQ
jgi:hypothetical protein